MLILLQNILFHCRLNQSASCSIQTLAQLILLVHTFWRMMVRIWLFQDRHVSLVHVLQLMHMNQTFVLRLLVVLMILLVCILSLWYFCHVWSVHNNINYYSFTHIKYNSASGHSFHRYITIMHCVINSTLSPLRIIPTFQYLILLNTTILLNRILQILGTSN